mmetsp:Transcript_25076/g.63839  ORF Transcript_25076/g.63839 Transcript_25076/m.63839 type:complete len:221 (+) Transcript_25076:513-1175(+)
MSSAIERSAAAARVATSRARPGASGRAASSSRRFATRRRSVAPKRRESEPSCGSRWRSLEDGSASCSKRGPAVSCARETTPSDTEGSPRGGCCCGGGGEAGEPRASAGASSEVAAAGTIVSQSTPNSSSCVWSVRLSVARLGTSAASSSSMVAGVRSASSPLLSGPGSGSRPTVWSARRLGVRNASATLDARGEPLAWLRASRTAASVSFAASSTRRVCR